MQQNIFDNASFGQHYLFDGKDCIFLQKTKYLIDDHNFNYLYELVVNNVVSDKSENEYNYTSNISATENGFVKREQQTDGTYKDFYVTIP